MPETIEFYSQGSKIKGHLYLPDSGEGIGPHPAIVLCHGFAGIKELLLPNFCRAFARAGYAALAFDYRGFGESEGDPGKISPTLQIQDIRSAITYMQARSEIDSDKIALWGSSYGGANAIVTAALDDRIKCLIVQLTFASGERVITGDLAEDEKEKLSATLNKIEQKTVLQNKGLMVPIQKVLTDSQSQEFYNDNIGEFPQLGIKIPFLTLKETIEHKPEAWISRLQVPILICAAENDGVNPVSESYKLFDAAPEPKKIFVLPGATHYEVYTGEKFELMISEQLSWLEKHIGVPALSGAADL